MHNLRIVGKLYYTKKERIGLRSRLPVVWRWARTVTYLFLNEFGPSPCTPYTVPFYGDLPDSYIGLFIDYRSERGYGPFRSVRQSVQRGIMLRTDKETLEHVVEPSIHDAHSVAKARKRTFRWRGAKHYKGS